MSDTQFFDILRGNKKYKENNIKRLNLRHRFIISAFKSEISGARVLDLASHDGRWAFAFAGAGAREVVGIEGRKELVSKFSEYPETSYKKAVRLEVGDIFDFLRRQIAQGEKYDVVGVLGIFYHIMNHYELLCLVRQLSPKLIIMDSEFMIADKPQISILFEDTSKELNSTAHFEGQKQAPIGIPTRAALDLMANSLGYRTDWLDWEVLPGHERDGVKEDYFRQGPKRRFTCGLRQIP